MAIKVNGTTVIDDSRALQNVASVDATTVAAMGAAGVGGSLEFLSETNITSDVSYIDISFPTGYRGFHLQFNQMFITGTDTNGVNLSLYLKDTGGNLINGSANYTWREYRLSSFTQSDYQVIGLIFPNWAQGAKRNVGLTSQVTIMSPRDADIQTHFNSGSAGRCTEYNNYQERGYMNMGNLFEASENIGCRVFADSSKTISADSHSYAIWGIK